MSQANNLRISLLPTPYSLSVAILPSPMSACHPKRAWFWIAIAAIFIALVALLVPHAGQNTNQPDWLALLPVIFIGLISPLTLQPVLSVLSLGRTPESALLVSSFQRPPPSRA